MSIRAKNLLAMRLSTLYARHWLSIRKGESRGNNHHNFAGQKIPQYPYTYEQPIVWRYMGALNIPLIEKYDIAIAALKHISRPLEAMRLQAVAENKALNINVALNKIYRTNYLPEIATEALEKLGEKA